MTNLAGRHPGNNRPAWFHLASLNRDNVRGKEPGITPGIFLSYMKKFKRIIKANAPQGQIDRWNRKRHHADQMGWRYVAKRKSFCRKANKWDAIHNKFSRFAAGW